MSETGFGGRQKGLVGLTGATRAASGGLLATALVVFVGEEGSLFAVGMLATVFHLGSMVFSPIWGTLGDVTGRRRTLLVGLSGCVTVVAFAFVFVDGVWSYVGLRGVYAVFVVGYGTLVLSLVGALGGSGHRGRATGFYKSAAAAGDVLAQVLVGVLLVALVPTQLFLLVGGLSLLATTLLLRLDDPYGAPGDDASLRSVLGSVRSNIVPDVGERALLHRTGVTWLYGGLALRHLAVKGVGSLVPIYLLTEVGVTSVVMGLLLAIGPATQMVLNPYVGGLADRSSRKRLIVLGILASGAYALVLGVASLPLGQVGRVATAGASMVLIAAGFAAMDIGVLSFVADSVPARREAEFIGLRETASGVGGVLGPTLVGIIATLAGYGVAFGAMGLLAIAAAGLTHRTLREPETRTPAPTEHRTIERQSPPATVSRHAAVDD